MNRNSTKTKNFGALFVRQRAVKYTIIAIFSLLAIGYVAVNVTNSWLVPRLVASAVDTNVTAINSVALYTEEFNNSILDYITSEESDYSESERSQLISQLDSLVVKINESKNQLEDGYFEDTNNFYTSVSESFDLFQDLISSSRDYISLQFCINQTRIEYVSTLQLIDDVLKSYDTAIYVYDRPESYGDLIRFYDLQYQVFDLLNTCFDLYSDPQASLRVSSLLDAYRGFVSDQIGILDRVVVAANAQDETELLSLFGSLAENEANFPFLYFHEDFIDTVNQVQATISVQSDNLDQSYLSVQENLRKIKSKYNLE